LLPILLLIVLLPILLLGLRWKLHLGGGRFGELHHRLLRWSHDGLHHLSLKKLLRGSLRNREHGRLSWNRSRGRVLRTQSLRGRHAISGGGLLLLLLAQNMLRCVLKGVTAWLSAGRVRGQRGRDIVHRRSFFRRGEWNLWFLWRISGGNIGQSRPQFEKLLDGFIFSLL